MVCAGIICDLEVGDSVEFAGPVGYPFAMSTSRQAGLDTLYVATRRKGARRHGGLDPPLAGDP